MLFRDLKFDLGVTGVKKGQILKLFQLQQDSLDFVETWAQASLDECLQNL